MASLTLLGAIWGSFVAALCSRWPKGESIMKGRSRCDQCGKQIASYDLIPVFSYVLLNGKCRNCDGEIGSQSLFIELSALVIGAVSILIFPQGQALAAAIFGWLLLPLVMLDFDHFWLPNRLVLLLAITGLFAGPLLAADVAWLDRAIGALLGFLSLEAVRLVYRKYRHRDGMGAGDPKLFGALGIWLGWQMLPMTLLWASVLGLIFFGRACLARDRRTAALPLGAYLAIAAYAVAWISNIQ